MQPWSAQSVFGRIYAYELISDSHQSFVTDYNSTTMAIVNAILPPPSVADVLLQGMNTLSWQTPCFQNDPHFSAAIRQQRDAMRFVYERLDVETIPATTQYRLLFPFMSWFNRNTGSSYVTLSQRDPQLLLFLLNLFSVVLVLVVALPATDTPFFASFRVRAVLDLARALELVQEAVCQGCSRIHCYRQVVQFPLNCVRLYQQHRRKNSS